MSVEWNTETEREFHEYFPVFKDEPQHYRVQDFSSDKEIDFLWWGIAALGCCAFWALLAVFCWGGNLVPRW